MSTPYAHRIPEGFSADEAFANNIGIALRLAGKDAKVAPGRPRELATGWTADRLEGFDDPWSVGGQFDNHRRQQPVPMVCDENGIWTVAPGSIFPDGTMLGREPAEAWQEQPYKPEPKPDSPALTQEEIDEAVAIAKSMIDGGADRDEIRQLLRNEGIEIEI